MGVNILNFVVKTTLLRKLRNILNIYFCKNVFHTLYVVKKLDPGGKCVGTLQKCMIHKVKEHSQNIHSGCRSPFIRNVRALRDRYEILK